MDESRIGTYVARIRSAHTTGPAHFVESEIAGDVITRCGRRMDAKTKDGRGLVTVVPSAVEQCRSCGEASLGGG